ncbi:hypothetical protein RTBOTA2_005367 [Rhodotorula toruloides]|uniref:FGENESH: predicted gene_11.270 protein n=1 Tax=Rhodotorula toruloides TaxID=5286 RepID=A0A0K3CLU6_RHOTO|nr:hypothetical protein RTBOTA2_005367 [Rhodotorula toruloides]
MSPSATRRPQRIDWHSMMMTEDDPIKIPTPRLGTPARMGTPRISTPARIPTPMPAHTQSEAAVFYQFLEAHEDHPAAPTPTDVWHNASSLFAFMVGSA